LQRGWRAGHHRLDVESTRFRSGALIQSLLCSVNDAVRVSTLLYLRRP
jgi:hypothetical protein